MSAKILSIAVLLLSVYLCFHSAAGQRGPSTPRPCCTGVTGADKSAQVIGQTYRKQEPSSRCVKAIIFNTDDGKLCADPGARWVKILISRMTEV